MTHFLCSVEIPQNRTSAWSHSSGIAGQLAYKVLKKRMQNFINMRKSCSWLQYHNVARIIHQRMVVALCMRGESRHIEIWRLRFRIKESPAQPLSCLRANKLFPRDELHVHTKRQDKTHMTESVTVYLLQLQLTTSCNIISRAVRSFIWKQGYLQVAAIENYKAIREWLVHLLAAWVNS